MSTLTEVDLPPGGTPARRRRRLSERARERLARSVPAETRRGYRGYLGRLLRWCSHSDQALVDPRLARAAAATGRAAGDAFLSVARRWDELAHDLDAAAASCSRFKLRTTPTGGTR